MARNMGRGLILGEMPMVAMNATLRQHVFMPEDTHVDADSVTWIRLSSAVAARRRFGSWTIDHWVATLEQEIDHRGAHCFKLFCDLQGSQWVTSRSKADRRAGR